MKDAMDLAMEDLSIAEAEITQLRKDKETLKEINRRQAERCCEHMDMGTCKPLQRIGELESKRQNAVERAKAYHIFNNEQDKELYRLRNALKSIMEYQLNWGELARTTEVYKIADKALTPAKEKRIHIPKKRNNCKCTDQINVDGICLSCGGILKENNE